MWVRQILAFSKNIIIVEFYRNDNKQETKSNLTCKVEGPGKNRQHYVKNKSKY